MTISVTRPDKDCYRVMVDGEIVGFALRMANNTWATFEPDLNTRADALTHKTPKGAYKGLLPIKA